MKKNYLFYFVLVVLFNISCASRPQAEEEIPEYYYDEFYEEDMVDPLPGEEAPDDDELDREEYEEIAEPFEEAEIEIIETEIEAETEIYPVDELAYADEQAMEAEPELELELQDVLAVEEPPAPEPAPAPVPVIEELPAEVVQQIPPPAIVQEPPVAEPPPVPFIPPPPVAMLGPAEDRRPVEEWRPVPAPVPPVIPIPPPPIFPPAIREDFVPPRADILPHGEELVFSRVVRATVGQTIEIPFRGNNWVFLGEIASRRGIVFSSSRRETEGMSFVFRADETGTYILRFFRRDHIRDFILNDHVQVIVEEAPAAAAGWFTPAVDRGRVTAERWPSALDEAAMLRGGLRPDAAGILPPPAVPGAVPGFPPDNLLLDPPLASITPEAAAGILVPPQESFPHEELQPAQEMPLLIEERLQPHEYKQRAREAFDAGNATDAIAYLDRFMESFPGGSDEAFWLYGQFYEANTPHRNILRSLYFYRRLVREFPQSVRFNDARRRIAFLERFFINIQ